MKRLFSLLALAMIFALPGQMRADITEGFDDITTLAGDGWFFQNNSDSPNLDWFQGNGDDPDPVFQSHEGAPSAYIAVNFNSTNDAVISSWMITPETDLNDGDVFSFWTRTVTGSNFPDRLELRLSTNGASTDVGTATTDVGDFTNLLVEVNPNLLQGPANYPEEWAQYTATVSGLGGPMTGRFAFRYWVTDAGPLGNNSNYIGVDTVEFATPIPEPTSAIFLAGLGLATCLIRRRVG